MNMTPDTHHPMSPGSARPISDGTIEIQYPQLQKSIVCGACLAGGIVTCVMCLLFLPRPMCFVGVPFLVVNTLLAVFFWRYFGSFVIRADANGISRTTSLHTQTVRWDEIDSMQMQRVGGEGGAILTLALEDAEGNTLLGFRRGFGTRPEQEQLLTFIRGRMAELQ